MINRYKNITNCSILSISSPLEILIKPIDGADRSEMINGSDIIKYSSYYALGIETVEYCRTVEIRYLYIISSILASIIILLLLLLALNCARKYRNLYNSLPMKSRKNSATNNDTNLEVEKK